MRLPYKLIFMTQIEKKIMMYNGKVILVDDNEAVLKTLRIILSCEFRTVVAVSNPTLLPALLRTGDVDIVLLDMNFGRGKQDGGEGLFWLDRILEQDNPPTVILITAFGDIELAVSSLKKGAADFIVKPWDNDKLIATLVAALKGRVGKGRTIHSSGKESGAFPDENNSRSEWIINGLVRKYAETYAKPLPRLTVEAVQKLSALAERGDLAVLQQVVERAVLLTDNLLLEASDFYEDVVLPIARGCTLEEMEKQFISEVLREKKGNLSLTALQLDISRQTLYNKMKKYDL